MLAVRAVLARAGRARLLPSLRTLVHCEPRLTCAVAALCFAAGLLPAVFALLMGALVGDLPAAYGAGLSSSAGRPIEIMLLAIAGLLMAGDVLAAIQDVVASLLAVRFTHDIRDRALVVVARPTGIAHLEDPALLGQLALVRDGMRWEAGDLVAGGTLVLTRFVQGVSAAALVATFSWWAALLLVMTWLGAWASAVRVVTGGLFDQLTAMRRAWYLRDLATSPGEAKEVRLFGMHPWLLERFTAAWRAATGTLWLAGRRDRYAAAIWLAVVTAAHALVLVLVARAAGHLPVARIAVIVQAVLAMAALGELGGETWVENGLRVVGPVLALERSMVTQAQVPAGSRPRRDLPARAPEHGSTSTGGAPVSLSADTPPAKAPVSPPHGGAGDGDSLPAPAICFAGVRFRYAGRDDDALAGLDLEIPAGRSLAIVGDNGAGKTTLVKLLTRLYEVDEGHIAVDGHDLRTIDPIAWRRQVAAVFQDFVHYELSAADNVGFGAPDGASDQAALCRAATRAGALDLIEHLPAGWATVLSPHYPGGVDLSGGQWQRIAMARALFAVEAGARVLILDEPTAALDARAEADLFDRFLALTQGLTTILISHRFSTVRRADQIAVLAGGRIVEQGTHEALIDTGGRYATMFALQAGRFNLTPNRGEDDSA